MVLELELQDYQVKVVYLGFMNQYFICVQLIELRYDPIDVLNPQVELQPLAEARLEKFHRNVNFGEITRNQHFSADF